MRIGNQTATFIAVAGCALAAASSARASWTLGNGDTVNLADVFAAGSDRTVYIDDKVFVFESAASQHFELRDITLIGFISNAANGHGLRNVGFDMVGGFGDAFPGDGVISEMNLQYQVSVNESAYEQGLRLCDARLTFNGSSYGTGAFARVDESIFDLDTNTLLGDLAVYDNFGPPRSTVLVDWEDFCGDADGAAAGFRAFEVNKNLKFLAPGEGGAASASFIRQEFSQVPAPGAIALLGLAGLTSRRRRS
jgi:MYXO-CTERM domain-containing protein